MILFSLSTFVDVCDVIESNLLLSFLPQQPNLHQPNKEKEKEEEEEEEEEEVI